MGMPLEPTEEQWKVIREAYWNWAGDEAPGRLFALIRDMVLFEAAKGCEAVMDRFNESAQKARSVGDGEMQAYEECGANGAANCIAALRAMKGRPNP